MATSSKKAEGPKFGPLLIATSTLRGSKETPDGPVQVTKDGNDHRAQRVFPWVDESQAKTWDGLFAELRTMLTRFAECESTMRVKGETDSGEPIDLGIRTPPSGDARHAYTPLDFVEDYKRGLLLRHQGPMLEGLKSEWLPEKAKAARKTKGKDFDPENLA